MVRINPFDEFPEVYEEWFVVNRFAYESELQAVKSLLPAQGIGMEVGVGSGQFAAPLGIRVGVEPSGEMRTIAARRGIEVVNGRAEDLPFEDGRFDFVVMVTTLCFLDDADVSFQEVSRVLKSTGCFIVGFVDKDSPIGRLYQEHKAQNPFYRIATFYSVPEVIECLLGAGFKDFHFAQTIFHDLPEIRAIEPVRDGYGEGSFVVISAQKN